MSLQGHTVQHVAHVENSFSEEAAPGWTDLQEHVTANLCRCSASYLIQ